jgi:cation:H+ antiporter
VTSIYFSFLIIVVAVFILIQAGKRVVRSLGVLARFLHVSEYVLSFILIAFATSLPELSVGINSALLKVPELSFGDILGTNIVNFTLILGTIAIAGGAVQLRDYDHFKSNRLFELTIVLAPLLLILDGTLSRIDGVILLGLFLWNIFRLLDIDDRILGRKVLRPHLTPYADTMVTTWGKFLKHLLIFVVSVSLLLISTMAVVVAVKEISLSIGISKALIGVLIVATATSLPDFVIGLRSVLKKLGGVALGDIFGAAAINSTLTLGIVSLISPIVLDDFKIVWIGIAFTIASFLLVFYFLKSKSSISRKEGIVLVGLYGVFVIIQLLAHLL